MYLAVGLKITKAQRHTIYVLLQNFCKRRKERGFEYSDRVWGGRANKSDKTGYALEKVLIKVRVARVLRNIAEDVDEPLQNGGVLSDKRMLRRYDDSRNTWEHLSGTTCKHIKGTRTTHKEVVLSSALRVWLDPDLGKEDIEKLGRERLQVRR
jgi:hypothetical protein